MFAGISNKISIITSKGDPFYSNVSLLLHMNGADNSTSFIDSSNKNTTVSANGNAKIVVADSKFGGSSGFFDGTGDFLQIANNSNFDFPSDFTIECFVKYSSTKLMPLYTRRVNSAGTAPIVVIQLNDSSVGNIRFYLYGASGSTFPSTTGLSLNDNNWHHIALSRSGSNNRLFIDGILRASSSTNVGSMVWTNSVTTIARDIFYTARDYNGYVDELRVTKGVARYTSNFTPPNAPFFP
jgi:hypothetical protein